MFPNHIFQCVSKQNHMKNKGLPQLQRRREAPERVAGPCEVRDTSQSIQYARSKLLLVHILFRTEKRITYVQKHQKLSPENAFEFRSSIVNLLIFEAQG